MLKCSRRNLIVVFFLKKKKRKKKKEGKKGEEEEEEDSTFLAIEYRPSEIKYSTIEHHPSNLDTFS